MTNKIIFSSPFKGVVSEPKPSLVHVPKAYKDLELFVGGSETNATVKRCVPFLDALTTGYIIPFPVDIEVSVDEKEQQINFSAHPMLSNDFSDLIGVAEHGSFQMPSNLRNPKRTIDSVFKFLCPWTVKTPPGYSCLFVTPMNHVLPFDLISGVVDTDTFPLSTHFPFYWTGKLEQRTVIKEGSPMAMVFPFKRESWKMETKLCNLNLAGPKKDLMFLDIFKTIANSYKNRFWSKKSYK